MEYVKHAQQGINLTMETLLVKRYLVQIRTEALEHLEYVKLAQQGINLTMETLIVKRFLVQIRTEELEH